jgi:hypothetical protein
LMQINKDIWASLTNQCKKKTQRSDSDAMSICEDAPGLAARRQPTNLSKNSSEKTRENRRAKVSDIDCFVADASRAAQGLDEAVVRTRSVPDFAGFREPEVSTRYRVMTESEALYCDSKTSFTRRVWNSR